MATLKDAKRLVVKIGSALLVDAATGRLKSAWLHCLAEDVAALKAQGTDVVIVSSGSIALGRQILDLPKGALSLEQAQAAAAVGQIRLARAYQEALGPHNITTAQVLLTLEDSANRRRYLNSRATFEALLSLGAVPIVNENDTVATDEIRFGDNDRLAAQIAATSGADQLVLLSDVDGLYTANPVTNSDATHIPYVHEITAKIEAMAGDPVSGLSKGGMKTKLMAAKTATHAGCAMAIADGRGLRPLHALETGAKATWFLADTDPRAARKRWIGSMKPQGAVIIDDGAIHALKSGKSLLPAGATQIIGDFGRGEPVEIKSETDEVIGQGLMAYTSDEARLIMGHQSCDIPDILNAPGRAAMIHRDDMVA
ncbi:MAG: glutamate 5-kinase [Halocynthiibacter sp.]